MLRRTPCVKALHRGMQAGAVTKGAFGICFVPTGFTGVVEKFGKMDRIVSPGLNFYLPVLEKVRCVNNLTQQADYQFEVKSKDNIFATLTLAAQVKVEPADSVKALYELYDPVNQIHAMLDSEIRAQASFRNLDQLFEEQEEISRSIFVPRGKSSSGEAPMSVSERLKASGFTLVNVLVRSIEPAKIVKESMNQINASLRMKEAKRNEADAHYLMAVREAEADRDRKRLIGEGVSQQRLAILKGYESGVNDMALKFGITPREIIDFVMKTQHLDTIEAIGRSNNAKTIFLSHEPPSSLVKGDNVIGGGSDAIARQLMAAAEATNQEAPTRKDQRRE